MARERKKIAGRKGTRDGVGSDAPLATYSTTPLAKPAARSQSRDQYLAFIRALARELARQDHARDKD